MELAVCYGGINTLVNLDTENRIIRRIAIGFASGICPGLTPKQPLTAADKAAITTVIQKLSKPATVKAGHYKVAIDSKEWASALITGKDPQAIRSCPALPSSTTARPGRSSTSAPTQSAAGRFRSSR